MKGKQLWLKRGLSMLMTAAMVFTSVPAATMVHAAEGEPASVLATALATYDFNDFSAGEGDVLTDGTRNLTIESAGSGKAPELVTDDKRGTVLSLTQQSYANRGDVLLPENPFGRQAIENGVTLSFWTKTTGNIGGGNCLIDFEVAPASASTEDRMAPGSFAINQSMVYWNTTGQNSNFTDFNTAALNLQKGAWKMVTMVATTEGLTFYSNDEVIEHSVAAGTENYEQVMKDLTGVNELNSSPGDSKVRLGASVATYWNCAGALLDDISFYGKALTAEEVATLYKETRKDVPLTAVSISGSAMAYVGRSTQLSVALVPADATVDRTATWSSSNEDVLTVDETGRVTGVAVGEAEVTATVAGISSEPFKITITQLPTKPALEDTVVLKTALANYDFDDFAMLDSGNLSDGTRTLTLESAGSGKKPELVEDEKRGKVLSVKEQSYANRGDALLPENPFAGQDIENGLTLNFWTKTTGTVGGGRCLIDFEVSPASASTEDRAAPGSFAFNQSMIYWNTTGQNGNFTDFNIGNMKLDSAYGWKMVTMVVTKSDITLYRDGQKISHSVSSGTEDYETMINDLAGNSEFNASPADSKVRLGASLATYWSCAGAYLDELSFFGKALTEEEIATLYQETLIRVPLVSVIVTGKQSVDMEKTIQLTADLVPADTTDNKTVTWTSSDESILTVDKNGKVTGVKAGTAKVTATVAGIASQPYEITVNNVDFQEITEEGYYLTVYSTTKNFYASASNIAQETRSVYMAVSEDGKNYEVLNNGGGVIFSKNVEGSLQVTEPKIMKDGEGFTVVAQDASADNGYHIFTSKDGVHYYDDKIQKEQPETPAPLRKSKTTLNLEGNNILESDDSITLGNAVSLTEDEYNYIVNKLGTVVNNGLESIQNLTVDYGKEVTVEKLASLYPSINATYTDGSTQKFNLDWSEALSGIDLTKAGEYTITAKVDQTKYINKLMEINGSDLYEDDPENTNPDEPDNYNETTKQVYYDATKFVEGMADPCIFWDEQTGYYYMTGSYFPEKGDEIDSNDELLQYDRVVLRKSKTLEGLQDRSKQVTIWKAGNQGYNDNGKDMRKGYRYIWAPEIHRVGNYWVVYFTESHGASDYDIYCHVLVLDGDKDPYETALEESGVASEWKDYKMCAADNVSYDPFSVAFCLDMTYFKDEVNGKSYVIWAGKPTAAYQGGNTDLFIATVDETQPWMITSEATRVTCADYGWERVRYCVNEGATVLQKDGNIFMCYSASGTGSEYAIGMCSAKGGSDLLDASSWTKSPYPLLTSRDVDGEEGPGHNSFTVDQDGNVIFVYHARPTSHNYQMCGWNGRNGTYNAEPLNDPCRHARLKRVHWAADGTPILKMTYEEELLDDYKTVSIVLTVKNDKKPDVKLTYAAAAGGKISGTAQQTIESGASGTTVTAIPDSGYKFVKWSDGLTTAARTDKNVTANLTVTAQFEKIQSDNPVINKPATKVKLNQTKLTIGVGEKVTLKATVTPSSVKKQGVTWTTSDKYVVTVNKGVIRGRHRGKATITVITADGKKKSCKVTVKAAPKKIRLGNQKVTLKKGETYKIRAMLPTGSASYKIKYVVPKKSKSKISVSSKGVIKAKAEGTAIIKVTAYNGAFAKLTVTVKKK